jgi:hypothetical protein
MRGLLPTGSSRPGSHLEPPAGDGGEQGLMVGFGLFPVAEGELGDGPLEMVATAEIGGDGDPIAGTGVGASQRSRAQPAIGTELVTVQAARVRRMNVAPGVALARRRGG